MFMVFYYGPMESIVQADTFLFYVIIDDRPLNTFCRGAAHYEEAGTQRKIAFQPSIAILL